MHRVVAGLSRLSLTGCLKPTLTDACTFGYHDHCPDSTGSTSTGGTTAIPTTTDGTTAPPDDTQAPGNQPPEFLAFTVGGSSNPHR